MDWKGGWALTIFVKMWWASFMSEVNHMYAHIHAHTCNAQEAVYDKTAQDAAYEVIRKDLQHTAIKTYTVV